jgi:ABC-2 type transport system permease protein
MRHFLTILSHEIRMLLVSPSTYIAAVFFLAVMGLIFTTLLEQYSAGPQETSPASTFFYLFWIPVVLVVPLLTMKSISEERRFGTLETLLTTPVSTFEVVLGKFGAAYVIYLLLWASTGGFFWVLQRFAEGSRIIDPGPMVGGYLFIALSGLFFVAVGIFASSLSRNQAVAGLLSSGLLFIIILGGHFMQGAEFLNNEALHPAKLVLEYSHVFQHLQDFTEGIVDTRQVLFYLSGAILGLIFSIFGIEAKLLHS